MTEEMEDLEPQEEFELEPISRKVTLRLRVGLKYETVDSEIIEIQEADDLYRNPKSNYTKKLIDAVL